MLHLGWRGALVGLLLGSPTRVSALELNINDTQSIQDAATVTVYNTLSNSSISGNVNPVYGDDNQWLYNSSTVEAWLYSTLIPFWNITGNDTYNDLITKRMYSKVDLELGTGWDESNNDTNMNHAAWALAAVTAAEMGFPADSSKKSWLTYAEQAEGTLSSTWGFSTVCGGGLESQNDDLSLYNASVKDAVSNGEYFQLASRLAYLTSGDDQTGYASDASTVWDWSVSSDMVVESNWTINFMVTNTTTGGNCTAYYGTRIEYTYPYGLYLSGAAYMYNVTGAAMWKTRAEGLLNTTLSMFVDDGVIVERGLNENPDLGWAGDMLIDDDEYALKGLLASCLAVTTRFLPDTIDTIEPLLRSTAKAVAKQCSGMSNGTVCGSDWTDATYDQNPNFFSSMSAVNAFTANLLMAQNSVSANTSGSSTSGTSSGTGSGTGHGGSSSGLSGGDIAGIVVGSVAGVALIAAALFFIFRKRKAAAGGAGGAVPEEHTATDSKGNYQAAEVEPNEIAELPQGAASYTFAEMDTDTGMASPPPQELPPQELQKAKTIRYELA